MKVRRLGVFGGTFDPIHSGHLVAAVSVQSELQLDYLIFVPTGNSWHKDPSPEASAQDRLAMVDLAIANHEGFTASSVDIERAGPTYTIDTLTDLQLQWEHDQPDTEALWFFVTGADALVDVPNWRDPSGILERARLVGVSRPGHLAPPADLLQGAFTLVEVATPDVASRQIRERVRTGQSIAELVPSAVAEYIERHRLYRDSGQGTA
ncbi:MAG: nicotinate-nucleotide adenylyltransferase [Actinomycetota bacterium]|nr:nicotinate-nucleotide adenylyltransferase [Actinomycetota bacterium]